MTVSLFRCHFRPRIRRWFLLFPFGGGGSAGRFPHPVYQWCSVRLAKQAFWVRGSASFSLVTRVAASVAQVPPVVLRGACLAYVPNLQAPVALQRSSLDGFDLRYRPSYGDLASLGQFPHCTSRALYPHGSKTVSSEADLSQLDVFRFADSPSPGCS